MEGGLKWLLIFIVTTTWADDSKKENIHGDKHSSALYTFLQNVLNARDDLMWIKKITSDKSLHLPAIQSTGDNKCFSKASLRRLRRHSILKRPGVNAEDFFSSDPEDSDPKSANDNDSNIVNAIKFSQDFFNEDVSSSALESDYDSDTLNVKEQTSNQVNNPKKFLEIANAYDIHNSKESEDRTVSDKQIEQKDYDLSNLFNKFDVHNDKNCYLRSQNQESTADRIKPRMAHYEPILNHIMQPLDTMNEYDVEFDKPKIKGTKINQKRTQSQEPPNCSNDRLYTHPQNHESKDSESFLVMAANAEQPPINSDNLQKRLSRERFSNRENDDWKRNVSKRMSHDTIEYPNVENHIQRDQSHEIFRASGEKQLYSNSSNTPQNQMNTEITPIEQLTYQQNKDNGHLYSSSENQELNQSQRKQTLTNEDQQNTIQTNNDKIYGNRANMESRDSEIIQHRNPLSNYEDILHKNRDKTIIAGLQDSNTIQMVHNADLQLNHEDDLLSDVDGDSIHPGKQETKSDNTAENKDPLSNDSSVKNNIDNASSNKGGKAKKLAQVADKLPKLIKNAKENITSETSKSQVNTTNQNEEIQDAQISNEKNNKNPNYHDSKDGKLSTNEDQLSNENNLSQNNVDKNNKTPKNEDKLLNQEHNFQNNIKDYTNNEKQCLKGNKISHNEDMVVKHQNNLCNVHGSIDKESKGDKEMEHEYQVLNDNNLENNTGVDISNSYSKDSKIIQTEANLTNKPNNFEAFSNKNCIHSQNQPSKDGKVLLNHRSNTKTHSKDNTNMENQKFKDGKIPQSNDQQLPDVHRTSVRTDSDYQTWQDKGNAHDINPSQKLSIQTVASASTCNEGQLNIHSNQNEARDKGVDQTKYAESYNKCPDLKVLNEINSEKVSPEMKNGNDLVHGNEFEDTNNIHPDIEMRTGIHRDSPSFPSKELDELDDESRLKASYIFSTMVSQHPYNKNNHHKIQRRDFKEIENLQDPNDKETNLLESDATGIFSKDQDIQYVSVYQNLLNDEFSGEDNSREYNQEKKNEQKKRKEELASNLKNLIDVNSKLMDSESYFDNYGETATGSYMRDELTPSEERGDHPLRIMRVEGPHTVRQKRTIKCLVDAPHVFYYPVDSEDYGWPINVKTGAVEDKTNLGCEIRDLFSKDNPNNSQVHSYNIQDLNVHLRRCLPNEDKVPDESRENYVAIPSDSRKRLERLSHSSSEERTTRCANIDIHEFVGNTLPSIPSQNNTFPPTPMRYNWRNTENNDYNIFENSDTESESSAGRYHTNYDTGIKTLINNQIITSLKAMFPYLLKNGEIIAAREEEEDNSHQQSNTNKKYNNNKDIDEDDTSKSSTASRAEHRKSKSRINKANNTDNNVSNQPQKWKENDSNNTENNDEIVTEDGKEGVQDFKTSGNVNTELKSIKIDPKNGGIHQENIADEIDGVDKISLSVETGIKKSKTNKADTKEVVDRKNSDVMENENHFKGKNKIQNKETDNENYYLDNTLSEEKEKVQEKEDIDSKTHNQNRVLHEKVKCNEEKKKGSDEKVEHEQNKDDEGTPCNKNCPPITNKDSSLLHKAHQQNSEPMLNERNKESKKREHEHISSGEIQAKNPATHNTFVTNGLTFPTRKFQAEERGTIDADKKDFKDDTSDVQHVDCKNGIGMRKNKRTILDNEYFESVLGSGRADIDDESHIRSRQVRVFKPDFNFETDDVPSANDCETDFHGNQRGIQGDEDSGTIQDIYFKHLMSDLEESTLPVNEYINDRVSDGEIEMHQSLFPNNVHQSQIYKEPSHLFPYKSVIKPTEYDRRSRNVHNDHIQKRTRNKHHSQVVIHPRLENDETFPTFESVAAQECQSPPGEEDKEQEESELKDAMSGDLARKIVDSILKKVHDEGTLQKHFVLSNKSRCPDHRDREQKKLQSICNRQKTEETMKSVLSVLQNLAKEEAKEKSCTKLSNELKSFLVWLLEKSEDDFDIDKEKDSFLFHKPPVPSKNPCCTSESGNDKECPDPKEIVKKISLLQNLINEYESLSSKDQIHVQTVYDNLLCNLNNLRKLVGLPPCPSQSKSPDTEESSCDTTTDNCETTCATTCAPTCTTSCYGIKEDIKTDEELNIVSTKNDEVEFPAIDHTMNLVPSPHETGEGFQEPLNMDHIDNQANTAHVNTKSLTVNVPNNDYQFYVKEKPDNNLMKSTLENLGLGDNAPKTGGSFANRFNFSINDLTGENMNSLNYAINNLGTSNLHGTVNMPHVESRRDFRSSPVISYSNNTYHNVEASDQWNRDQRVERGTNEKWDSLKDDCSRFSPQIDGKTSIQHDQSYSKGSLARSGRHKRLQRDNEYRMHENRHYVRYNPAKSRHQDDDEYYKTMEQEEQKFPVSAEYEKLVAKAAELEQEERNQKASNRKKSGKKRRKAKLKHLKKNKRHHKNND